MTKKLYNTDSSLSVFTAQVISCEQKGSRFLTVLDQTAFFPEGGGQAGDVGTLNAVQVLDTQERNGIIYHETAAPLEIGTQITGRIDWPVRFSRMQQHSGEHIVSGLIHQRFGYDNVGFHLGNREVTLDFNGTVTKEELKEIETQANRIVYRNLPVKVSFPSDRELKELPYRSKKELDGQVRIITIPGVDVCACCAPHVEQTGAIGLIKLTQVQSHRGGVRITMLCGSRALEDYREKEQSVRDISVLLSAREEQVALAVQRLKEEQFALNGRLMQLWKERVQEKAAAITPGTENAVFFEDSMDSQAMRELINLLTSRCSGIICVFSGNGAQGFRYILGSASRDVRPLGKHLNEAFQGKGGGKPEMVQGSLFGTEDSIQEAIRKAMQSPLP